MKTVLDFARAQEGLPNLYWPTLHDREDSRTDRDIELRAVKFIYRAYISEAQQVKEMLREGQLLADQGEDPRIASSWNVRANHAWLVRHLATPVIVNKRYFQKHGARGLNQAQEPNALQLGPSYLAPAHSPRASQGIVGKLRWFYPSLQDTIVFFALFQLTTGWNESTALRLDITDPHWATTHKLQPRLKLIAAVKIRGGYKQYAVSLEHSEWRPYRIVLTMLEISRGLRSRLLADIADLERRLFTSHSPKLKQRLAELRERSKSPWLFHSLDNIGEVLALNSSFNGAINASLKDVIQRHDIRDSAGNPCRFTASDWRDAFAAHSEETGGAISARASLGHASERIINRYLNQARLRRRSMNAVRTLVSHAVGEIHSSYGVDGSSLKILVERGTITEEQRRAIADFKNRSRLGMGCIDPKSPPPYLAPDHPKGALCRVQRCAMCSNAVRFEDSIDGLARRYAELICIERSIPAITWSESDFPDEKEATETVLSFFPRAEVDDCVARYLSRFADGTDVVHDLEASYETKNT